MQITAAASSAQKSSRSPVRIGVAASSQPMSARSQASTTSTYTMSDVGMASSGQHADHRNSRRTARSRCPIASCSADMPPAHHEPGSRGRGRSITLGNIIEAIRAIALRNRYVARCGFRGTSLEMKTLAHYGQICHHYGQAMSVVAERVVAPHGWLRYDVERIRSVRHLTDPKTRPDRPRGVRFLCEALSGVEAQHRVELHELTGSRSTGLTGGVLTGHYRRVKGLRGRAVVSRARRD